MAFLWPVNTSIFLSLHIALSRLLYHIFFVQEEKNLTWLFMLIQGERKLPPLKLCDPALC